MKPLGAAALATLEDARPLVLGIVTAKHRSDLGSAEDVELGISDVDALVGEYLVAANRRGVSVSTAMSLLIGACTTWLAAVISERADAHGQSFGAEVQDLGVRFMAEMNRG